jgi:hypothetical protein
MWSRFKTGRHISKYSYSLTQSIIVLQERSKQTKVSSIRGLFHDYLPIKRKSHGICVMSLGTIYYDPKHTAGFSSVGKLVNAAKSNKKNVESLSGQDMYTTQTRT